MVPVFLNLVTMSLAVDNLILVSVAACEMEKFSSYTNLISSCLCYV